MTGTFLSRVQGFTPVIDVLVEELGLIPAAMYGLVWRYCQGERGVCQASLDTLAERLHINRRTALRHLKHLVREGYLEDLTPDLRNHPHTYADAGRAEIDSLVQARVHRRAARGVTLSHCGSDFKSLQAPGGVTLSHCGSDFKSLEERREDKRETRRESDAAQSELSLSQPSTEPTRLWLATRDALQAELSPEVYDTWIRDSHAVSLDGHVLVVGVQSAYAKDWLENRLYSQVQHTVTEIRGKATSVRFIIRRNSR
jgi:DNA-binding MarR family transcriptional regulator